MTFVPPVMSVHLFNALNAELNPICHLLALLETHPILHVSRIRVKKLRSLISWLVGYGLLKDFLSTSEQTVSNCKVLLNNGWPCVRFQQKCF